MIRIGAKGRNNGSVVRMTDITLTEDLDAIPSTSYAPKTRIFFLWFLMRHKEVVQEDILRIFKKRRLRTEALTPMASGLTRWFCK